jgi:hypothetical protein
MPHGIYPPGIYPPDIYPPDIYPPDIYPPFKFEGYSTGRTHKRQNMDTSIRSVGSHHGFHLIDGSNQNVSKMVCF